MKQFTIKVTVTLERSLWVGIFERTDKKGYAVARKLFGGEPADPQLYEFISTHFYQLKFTEPHDFKLVIKRKNPKRILREVRREMERAKADLISETRAQEVLRFELEKNKKTKKKISRTDKQAKAQRSFLVRQEKKKKKKRGH